MANYDINKAYCKCCNQWLPIDQFFDRPDRVSAYGWCIACMWKNGRTEMYPLLQDQGGGKCR